MRPLIKNFLHDEEGASAIEYALLAALIAVAFITGATLVGTSLNSFLTSLGNCLANTANCNF